MCLGYTRTRGCGLGVCSLSKCKIPFYRSTRLPSDSAPESSPVLVKFEDDLRAGPSKIRSVRRRNRQNVEAEIGKIVLGAGLLDQSASIRHATETLPGRPGLVERVRVIHRNQNF